MKHFLLFVRCKLPEIHIVAGGVGIAVHDITAPADKVVEGAVVGVAFKAEAEGLGSVFADEVGVASRIVIEHLVGDVAEHELGIGG